MAGVFESGVSHHHPIVCFIDGNIPIQDKNSNFVPKYDYCESNLNSFNESMQELCNINMIYSEQNFERGKQQGKVVPW